MQRKQSTKNFADIRVIGIGGGGCNAVNHMIRQGLNGVEFFALNTDLQALKNSLATTRYWIGKKTTRGLGLGKDIDLAEKIGKNIYPKIKKMCQGADMIFVTATLGGGTGTGIAPIIAQAALECGAVTVGVVSLPFDFEGTQKARIALDGLNKLRSILDTIIVIPNDRLMTVDPKINFTEAFEQANQVLYQSIQGISEIVTIPGDINVDFADLKAILAYKGPAIISIGYGFGEDRALMAAEHAMNSNLLGVNIRGAKAILYNVMGSITAHEMNLTGKVIGNSMRSGAEIIFGAVFDEKENQMLQITLVAKGCKEALPPFYQMAEDVQQPLADEVDEEPLNLVEEEEVEDSNVDLDDASSEIEQKDMPRIYYEDMKTTFFNRNDLDD